jgi:hypothetical protein
MVLWSTRDVYPGRHGSIGRLDNPVRDPANVRPGQRMTRAGEARLRTSPVVWPECISIQNITAPGKPAACAPRVAPLAGSSNEQGKENNSLVGADAESSRCLRGWRDHGCGQLLPQEEPVFCRRSHCWMAKASQSNRLMLSVLRGGDSWCCLRYSDLRAGNTGESGDGPDEIGKSMPGASELRSGIARHAGARRIGSLLHDSPILGGGHP